MTDEPETAETLDKPKRGVGRPSLYKPEYCDRVIELGEQGCWLNEMAADLDVDRVTLLDWENAHEEFATALARAKVKANAWFEAKGRNSVDSKVFQSRPWEVLLKGRDGDYREKQEITGRNGAAIEITLSQDDMDL
jgi:transposase